MKENKVIKDRILRTELVEWRRLKPFQPQNLKTMSTESFDKLKNNIIECDFITSFYVWQDSEKEYWLLDGHHRIYALEALDKEGYKISPTFSCSVIDADNAKEAVKILLSYSSSHAKLDPMGLNEFITLNDLNWDELNNTLDLNGIDLKELQLENIELPDPQCDEDEAPDLAVEATTKTGDVWILGQHRLLCGDTTDLNTVEKLMNGEKADMVFTDPPYNTGMTAESQKGSGGLWKGTNGSSRLSHMFDDAFEPQEWQDFMAAFMAAYWIITKEDCTAYICLDWRRNHELIPHIENSGFKRSNLIVWDKMVHGLGSDYKYTHEFINVCKKGKPRLDTHQGEKEYSDVWHIQRKIGKDEDHATKKPIELVERSLRHASKKGDLIVDLFGGSGSTLIACEKNGRKCYTLEISPSYCDVIIKRWQKFSGKKATHAETGKSFDELSPLV